MNRILEDTWRPVVDLAEPSLNPEESALLAAIQRDHRLTLREADAQLIACYTHVWRPPAGPPVQFHARYSWRGAVCGVCGRQGYASWRSLIPPRRNWYRSTSWMTACAHRGHLPCDYCSRQLTVKLDGTVRVHTRCPAAP